MWMTGNNEPPQSPRGRVIYSGTIVNRRRSKSDALRRELDNDEQALQRDAARFSAALSAISPELRIVVTKRDDSDSTSDLFILCEASLKHEAAIADYLARNEDGVRYALVPTQHMMTIGDGHCNKPLRDTLAIRRQALRKMTRWFWVTFCIKALVAVPAFYCAFLLYCLLFSK